MKIPVVVRFKFSEETYLNTKMSLNFQLVSQLKLPEIRPSVQVKQGRALAEGHISKDISRAGIQVEWSLLPWQPQFFSFEARKLSPWMFCLEKDSSNLIQGPPKPTERLFYRSTGFLISRVFQICINLFIKDSAHSFVGIISSLQPIRNNKLKESIFIAHHSLILNKNLPVHVVKILSVHGWGMPHFAE